MPGDEDGKNGMTPYGGQLAAAASGDDEALAVLVRTYHDRVYRFGVRVCRDGYDADDAVQDAFAKLAKRPDVIHDPSVLSWLLTVVRNACRRMLRPFAQTRRALGETLEDDEPLPSNDLDPEKALQRWQLVQAVHTERDAELAKEPVGLDPTGATVSIELQQGSTSVACSERGNRRFSGRGDARATTVLIG